MFNFDRNLMVCKVWLLVVVLSLVMVSAGFAGSLDTPALKAQANTIQGKVVVMGTDTNADGSKYASIKLVCSKCNFNMGERTVNLPADFHDEFTCNKCKYYNTFDAQLQ